MVAVLPAEKEEDVGKTFPHYCPTCCQPSRHAVPWTPGAYLDYVWRIVVSTLWLLAHSMRESTHRFVPTVFAVLWYATWMYLAVYLAPALALAIKTHFIETNT